MVEYDEQLISKILDMEGFEIENLDISKIQHVPMHQYRINTLEKPYLLVENLQICIGLYACSNNFGFAAHLNPSVIENNEFLCNEDKEPIYCNRIDDLHKCIIEKCHKENTIFVGIVLGSNPILKTYSIVELNQLRN